MAAYRRVYDSRHMQAVCQEPGSAPEPYPRNRVWAAFTFTSQLRTQTAIDRFIRFAGLAGLLNT